MSSPCNPRGEIRVAADRSQIAEPNAPRQPKLTAKISRRFQLSKGTAAYALRGAGIAWLDLVWSAVAGLEAGVKRWNAALRATVVALVIAISCLGIAPVAQAAAAAARLSVSSTWQTGFIAHFAIVNASTVPMTDWRLEFDLPAGESISHTWSSNFAQYGTHYVLTPANWNRIIAPGGTATGGLRGVLSGTYSPPSNCVLNGLYRCT